MSAYSEQSLPSHSSTYADAGELGVWAAPAAHCRPANAMLACSAAPCITAALWKRDAQHALLRPVGGQTINRIMQERPCTLSLGGCHKQKPHQRQLGLVHNEARRVQAVHRAEGLIADAQEREHAGHLVCGSDTASVSAASQESAPCRVSRQSHATAGPPRHQAAALLHIWVVCGDGDISYGLRHITGKQCRSGGFRPPA